MSVKHASKVKYCSTAVLEIETKLSEQHETYREQRYANI